MAEKTDAWMPLWIGAYLADTLTFTTLQHGAYMLLLMAYWRERAPLPDDDEALRSIAKVDRADWKKLRPVLARKFKVADGVWWHKRVEHEMAEADERAKQSSSKAKAAAEARWGKRPKQSPSNAPGNAPSIPHGTAHAMPEQCPTPSPTPSPLRGEKKPPRDYPPEFESAWEAYPARPGASKADAFKAWSARVKAGAEPAAILAGTTRYAAFCEACSTEPNFIKQPATFFGPGEHYLSDWSVPAPIVRAPASNTDRRAATIAGLTNPGEPHGRDDRTVDAEAHLVG